jgi:hypothetical protein
MLCLLLQGKCRWAFQLLVGSFIFGGMRTAFPPYGALMHVSKNMNKTGTFLYQPAARRKGFAVTTSRMTPAHSRRGNLLCRGTALRLYFELAAYNDANDEPP